VLKVDSFKARGREYKYWVVRHGEKRCIIKRYVELKPTLSPQKVPTSFKPPLEEEKVKEEEAQVQVKAEAYPREFQRRAWYAVKIGSSVGALKENPTKENFEKLKATAAQVEERLGVAVGELLKAAEDFLAAKTDTAKMRLNEALTLVIIRIFSSLLIEREKVKGGEAAISALTPLTAALSSLEEKVSALTEKVSAFTSIATTVQSLEQRVNTLAEKLDALSTLPAAVKTLEGKVAALEEKLSPPVKGKQERVRGLKRAILEVLSDGKERLSADIAKEVFERFSIEASYSSVRGRLVELAKLGLVTKEKRGEDWYWRLSSPPPRS